MISGPSLALAKGFLLEARKTPPSLTSSCHYGNKCIAMISALGETGKPLTWQCDWNNSADSRAIPVILFSTVGWREKGECKTVNPMYKHKCLKYLVTIL